LADSGLKAPETGLWPKISKGQLIANDNQSKAVQSKAGKPAPHHEERLVILKDYG
jgi:hypothetical protein